MHPAREKAGAKICGTPWLAALLTQRESTQLSFDELDLGCTEAHRRPRTDEFRVERKGVSRRIGTSSGRTTPSARLRVIVLS
jgi:hypothetical protein